MDIKLLKSDILSNNIPNFLIFIEYEPALSKQYINSIVNTTNKPYKFYDNADSVIYDITTNIKEDCVYVIYNDDKILKNQVYVDNLIKLNRNIIVVFPDIDKSTNFYKTNKNYIVLFEQLDKYTLLAYVEKLLKKNKIEIDQKKLISLIEYTNCNLGILLNELDKIIALGQDNSNTLMDYMLHNGFSDYREINVFNFINKVASKDKSAFDDLAKLSDSSVTIVYNLYNTAKKRLEDTKNPYYGKVMKLCYEVYNGVIDGTMSDKYAIQYLMWRIYG